jgi:IS30 family transposase
LDVYFAKPYHSWERGTNENTNGLIRRLYPKQSSFANIREDELARIERYLNDRPRKCLGWRRRGRGCMGRRNIKYRCQAANNGLADSRV